MIKPVIALIRALQSGNGTGAVAAGVVLSLYFGLVPLAGTQTIFLVLLFFLLKINRAATVLCLPLVKAVYWLGADRAADAVGHALLTAEPLRPAWVWITRAPVLALFNLNHTGVLGGWVLAAALSWPVYQLASRGVRLYRDKLGARVNDWKAVRWLKSLALARWLSSWWPHEP